MHFASSGRRTPGLHARVVLALLVVSLGGALGMNSPLGPIDDIKLVSALPLASTPAAIPKGSGAHVELPARASGAVRVEDIKSGMALTFTLRGAGHAPVEV